MHHLVFSQALTVHLNHIHIMHRFGAPGVHRTNKNHTVPQGAIVNPDQNPDPPSYFESTQPYRPIKMSEKADLPTRSNTTATTATNTTTATSDDEAVPEGDPSTTTGLLMERVQAWKHMCRYLEDYITAVSKDEKTKSKEQERILKVRLIPHCRIVAVLRILIYFSPYRTH